MENNRKLEISAENALNAYNNTDANGRELLEHLFGKELFKPKDIRERVGSFDDAVAVLGNDHQAVVDYYALCDATCTGDILAYAKLRIIAEALNEGWKPKFDGEECRYYPWFYIYTKEELDSLDDEERSRVLGRSHYNGNANGGVACADAYSASSISYTRCGSRLAFKTRELAEYCGKQFIEIWADFVIG